MRFKSDEELQLGDIAISVEGKRASSLNQINKLIKSMPTQFTLRIERKISSVKNSQHENVSSGGSGLNISSAPVNCPIYSGLRRRKGSESESCSSTPSTSLPG